LPLRLARAVQDPERLKQSMLSPAKNSRSRWQGRIFNSTSRLWDVLLFFPTYRTGRGGRQGSRSTAQTRPLETRKKFDLKDMLYMGKLEL